MMVADDNEIMSDDYDAAGGDDADADDDADVMIAS